MNQLHRDAIPFRNTPQPVVVSVCPPKQFSHYRLYGRSRNPRRLFCRGSCSGEGITPRLHRVFAIVDREHGLGPLRLFLEGVLDLPRREQVANFLDDFLSGHWRAVRCEDFRNLGFRLGLHRLRLPSRVQFADLGFQAPAIRPSFPRIGL